MEDLVYKPLLFLSIQCGTKNQRQIEGNSSFFLQNQIHIQQSPQNLSFRKDKRKQYDINKSETIDKRKIWTTPYCRFGINSLRLWIYPWWISSPPERHNGPCHELGLFNQILMKDTHSKSLFIEWAGWALKAMLTITDSWEVSRGQPCPSTAAITVLLT